MRNGTIRTISAWAGGAVAVLVVLLLTTLLAHMAAGPSGRPIGSGVGSDGTPTVTPYPNETGTATIGSKYVTSAVTATGVDSNGNALNPTGFFTVGQRVYVVVQVRNPPAGQHHLLIEWYLNGQPVAPPPEVAAGLPVSGSANVSFNNVFSQAGRGTARIYWDMPSDTSSASDLNPDAFLAQVVAFEVQDPNTATSTPPPTPKPGRTPTPGPTLTPPATPTATLGP